MIAFGLAVGVLVAVCAALALLAAIGINGETSSGTYGMLVVVMLGTILLAGFAVASAHEQATLEPGVRDVPYAVPLPIPWPVGAGLEARHAVPAEAPP